MVDLELREKLSEFIRSMGIECYGFVECRRFEEIREYLLSKFNKGYITEFEESDIEKRIDPFLYFKEGKSIISIAIPYLREGEYNLNFSKYTNGLDYHFVVNSYLKRVCEFIEGFGYECKQFCDSNNLPERYIAYLCSVGHIGRNSLIYTQKYGSYVFLGEIITNAELCYKMPFSFYKKKQEKIKEFEFCGKCVECLRKCPNSVLGIKNFKKCISNLTQQKNLTEEEMERLNGMVFGCDICQDVCPKNSNIEYSFEKDFDTLEFLKNITDKEIALMNNSYFKNNFKKSSCSWRGKNLLKRNVIIKNKKDFNFIQGLDFGENEYLNKYKNIILNEREK